MYPVSRLSRSSRPIVVVCISYSVRIPSLFHSIALPFHNIRMPFRTTRIQKRRTESDSLHEKQKNKSSTKTGLSLKRLLLVLVFTTSLLFVYHLFRLSSKGKGILSSSIGSSILPQSSGANAGGMILHPTQGQREEKIRLEDLDMETLQAAFDALYGDGGPLGPKRGRGGQDGQYSHVFRSKNDQL
ncbi:unnamed protein product [Sympodiomycopsis kandeliae]